MRARLFAVLLAGLVVAAPLTAVATPQVDPGHGKPGFCPTDEGVTVVIDFQALGGTTIVRCAPGPVGRGFTGHSALLDAGIELDGTRRWGEAFICRLEGRPGANEVLPVKGRENYKESCIDTPPASGYWSYWHASNGGQWQYSQWGVKNREALRGGFEGWSFSLNASADTNPKPRITPRRPGSAPQPQPTKQPSQRPTSNDPGETQGPQPSQPSAPTNGQDDPGSTVTIPGNNQNQSNTQPSNNPTTGRPSTTAPGVLPTTSSTLPPGLPRNQSPTSGDPRSPTDDSGSGDVAWSGGEVAASSDVPKGIPTSTVLTGFAVLILLAAAFLTAQHRRRPRT
ncbi:hypothetical protein AB0P21_10490 [Kribbella sp. NPDC056861]|uniref:hypothetical protein n=1 Tax=Kribbella sp. NPDC056861 TaxID=3154857 RepID=UPI003439CA83